MKSKVINKTTNTNINNNNRDRDLGLWVDRWSVLQEYINFCPKQIKKVEYKSPDSDKLVNEMKKNPNLAHLKFIPMKAVLNKDTEFQGTIRAEVSHETLSEEDFFEAIVHKTDLNIVALDHITDPHNLGAVVRSAAFFGISYVVIPKDRQVHLTQTVLSTSQGGFCLTKLVVVQNLARFLTKIKEHGFWVAGTAMDGKDNWTKVQEISRKVIVFGSEDKGLSLNVSNKCDFLLSINGAKTRINSLNVSVSCGIALEKLS